MVILNKYKTLVIFMQKLVQLLQQALCHDIDNDVGEVVDVNDKLPARDN